MEGEFVRWYQLIILIRSLITVNQLLTFEQNLAEFGFDRQSCTGTSGLAVLNHIKQVELQSHPGPLFLKFEITL